MSGRTPDRRADPPAGSGAEEVQEPATDPRGQLPARAVMAAVGGLLVGNVAAVIGYAIGDLATPTELLVPLILSELALWAGMLGACRWASARLGSGSFRTDFGWRPRRFDAGWGLLLALVDWIAAGVVAQLVGLLGKGYAGSNATIVTDVRHDVPALVATIAFAVVGAPIVEELFFRGLLQRSLESWAGVPVAIVLQGLIFGAVHIVEITGKGQLGLWLSLSAVGIVHGVAYQRFKRITVSIWAHAIFNLGGVVLIFAAMTGS